MITYIGPKQRDASKKAIKSKLNTIKNMYLICFMLVPISFLLFHYEIISAFEKITGDRMATAKLITNSGTGTAFLINNKGMLLTAKHCVEDINEDELVTLDFTLIDKPGYSDIKAKVIYMSDNEDYAILKTDNNLSNIDPIRISKRVEDPSIYAPSVSVIGYPAIVETQSINEEGSLMNFYFEEDTNLFILNDRVFPGNSGGPIIDNETKEVIGICSFKISDGDHKFKAYAGLAFCVKVQDIPQKTNHLDW